MADTHPSNSRPRAAGSPHFCESIDRLAFGSPSRASGTKGTFPELILRIVGGE